MKWRIGIIFVLVFNCAYAASNIYANPALIPAVKFCRSRGFVVNTLYFSQCVYTYTEEELKIAQYYHEIALVRSGDIPAINAFNRASGSCESGNSIMENFDSGRLIKLDDGTLWEINFVDTSDTLDWEIGDNIVICDGKLINTDENESADATQIYQ